MSVRSVVRVVNRQGVHARPVSMLVRVAQRFECRVSITGPNGHRADARSAMDMLGLEAGKGSELVIEADGPDADVAVAALRKLVDSGFEDDC